MNRETDIGSSSEPIRKARPGLNDPYEHAPPKPDGDPWAILLKPEMEADKMRCDAWKDEVQNLLIFAGLFSAVVTAFVIESYKFLQPDPNDAIISLLSQIVNSPNTTSSPLFGGTSTSTAIPFVQKSSSVRINVFWFISLILSLTTVLVGTIALQWLREHQSYPGLSPKETLPMLHMRTQALEAWYVPQIFAALPLLLQGALILFLAGLIDFTLPLGVKLSAPVACIVGLILLFLAATTALPAFQPLFLLSGYFSRNTVPTPCAFKSPQSQVLRTLSGLLLHLISFVFPKIYLRKNQRYRNIKPYDLNRPHLFPYIYTVWHPKTWPTFDSHWLYLRDAWHHGILDKDTDLYKHRLAWRGAFPLSDITQCLVKTTTGPRSAKHTEEYLVAACYCFQEISAAVWKCEPTAFDCRKDRLNNYFEQIFLRYWPNACSISKFLIHGGQYDYGAHSLRRFDLDYYIQQHNTLFLQDQVYLFLDMLARNRRSTPVINRYQLEIHLRVVQHLFMGHIKSLVPIATLKTSSALPTCFISYHDKRYIKSTKFYDDLADLLSTTFETAIADTYNKDDELINPLYTHIKMMPMVITMLADGIIYYLLSVTDFYDLDTTHPEKFDCQYLHAIGETYSSAFHSIAGHLNDEITSEMLTPSLLFELSAMLLQSFLYQVKDHPGRKFDTISRINDNSFSQGFTVLLDAVARYKQQMAGPNNDPTKMRFAGNDYIRVRTRGTIITGTTARFSDEWWTALFLDYDDSGLRSIQKLPAVPSSTPLDISSSQSLTSAPDEGCPPLLGIIPERISLHIHPENITDMVISSYPTSHPDTPHIPNPNLDQLGQAAENPTGAHPQAPTSSSHSLPELIVRSDGPPHNTGCDSITDSDLGKKG